MEMRSIEVLRSNNRIPKTVIYLLLIGVALTIELLFFNYQPLFHKSADIQYEEDQEERDWRYNISKIGKQIEIDLTEPTYYRKLFLDFTQKKQCKYSIQIQYMNEFDSLEEITIKDIKESKFYKGVTNINKKVKRITITLSGRYKGDVKAIKLTNHIQLNKFRCLFIYTVLFTIAFFFMEKSLFSKRPELVFLVIATILSINYCYSHGIQENGWDDDVHFQICYYLSYGKEVPVTKTVEWYSKKIPLGIYNTLEEKYMVTDYMNKKHNLEEAHLEAGISFRYPYVNYLLEIGAMKIGRIFDMSFSQIYMFTKWINLFTYIIVMTITIAIAKKGKLYLTFLGLLPINLFVAGTITYNTQVFAFITLALTFWMNELLEPDKKIKKRNLFWFLLCFGIGVLTKLIYAPLILLNIFLPKTKFKNEKQKKRIIIVFFILCLIGIAVFAVPILIRLFSGQLMTGDLRGGDTDVILQLKSILQHPFSYIKMFFSQFVQTFADYFLGKNAYIMFGRFGKMPNRFLYLTVVTVLVLAFIQPEKNCEVWLTVRQKIGVAICLEITILLIWLSMYLSYTPVGKEMIAGVQPRYYGPMLLPLFLICQNKKMTWKIAAENYNQIILGSVCFLNLYGIYFTVIKPWIL